MEVILLLALGLIWIMLAAIYDWKTTEIPDWLNFSLVIFALGIRFFYSLFSAGNFNFFYQGLIGFGIFLVIGNLMFYGRIFGGGDAKLMYGLGAILPFSNNLFTNLEIFISFLFLFLFAGGIYGLFAATYIALKNRKKFWKKLKILFSHNIVFVLAIISIGTIMMVLGIILDELLLYSGILIFALPFLYLFTKSVDESCMEKEIMPEFLREGDLLYRDIRIGKKLIKVDWNGLTKEEIKLLRKRNKPVLIKQGICFGIVFLISFLLLIYFYFINTGLWNSFW